MFYIRAAEKSKWREDKYYNTNSSERGHFIIAIGYKIVDGKNCFEIYDSYSWDNTYNDGSPKGDGRILLISRFSDK